MDDTKGMADAIAAVEVPATQKELTSRLTATLADISDSLAVFDICGARSADILMTAFSLDLRTDAFVEGRVVRSLIADISVVIWKTEPQRFRCLVDQSWTGHFWDWLTQSSTEW